MQRIANLAHEWNARTQGDDPERNNEPAEAIHLATIGQSQAIESVKLERMLVWRPVRGVFLLWFILCSHVFISFCTVGASFSAPAQPDKRIHEHGRAEAV